ncbi:hypothetical protein ABTX62_31745 [Streptomyces sp. NPDC096046]|uniref:Orn/Lys/Arg family decarboxylase n=1 Tax=Streptomyces sp. NPDC096046 TaxID=3155542 RepID=UPI00331FFE9D
MRAGARATGPDCAGTRRKPGAHDSRPPAGPRNDSRPALARGAAERAGGAAREESSGPAEAVPVAGAAGRIVAEMITPYPPGIPAILPGKPDRAGAGVSAHGAGDGCVAARPEEPEPEKIRVLAENPRALESETGHATGFRVASTPPGWFTVHS